MKLEELLEKAKEIEFVAKTLPGVIEDILNEIGHDEFRMTTVSYTHLTLPTTERV